MRAGVAISPDTASTAITDDVGNAADMLLVMTVYPGMYARVSSVAGTGRAAHMIDVKDVAAKSFLSVVCPKWQSCVRGSRARTLRSTEVLGLVRSMHVHTQVSPHSM